MTAAPRLRPPSPDLLARFADIVGPAYALSQPADIQPFLVEPRDKYVGATPLVLRPGSTDEISRILALADETRTSVVPQGGNTGMVGGQIPFEGGEEIVVSLGRLDKVRAVDAEGGTMTLEAGVTLARAQELADGVDRFFPLSLGSEGTCQIGGNLASNAGGTAVLAYGNTRDLCLGLEVVLASGEVWQGLRTLRKDNTGYDLKDLFIGSEGTLGIITAAVLKLFPKPKGRALAVAGLAGLDEALALFNLARGSAGQSLTSFELMPRRGIEFLVRHLPGARDPLASAHAWYVLAEVSSGRSEQDARETLETVFEAAVENGLVEDGVIAKSLAEAQEFWRLRHSMSEIQKHEGGSIKHDVSVPVASVPDFIRAADACVTTLVPGARPVPFGHLGDGNIHYNVTQPVGADKAAYLARWEEMNAAVHEIVASFGGSISAEHGIGRLKRDLLPGVKSPVEMALMRKIKASLDPNGILNPGKVL